ncbi:MAG: SRPBCC family protein [Pirellulales bacterium]
MLAGGPDWLGWALFACNLPFVWIALSMSVRRSVAAGPPPWLGLAVLVPVVGLAVMLGLCLDRHDQPERWRPPGDDDLAQEAAGSLAGLRAVGAALGVGVVMLVLCVYLLQSYGAALFLATPLVMGTVAGFLFNQPTPRSLAATVGLATIVMLAAALVLLVFALEGLICIAMAAPIAAPLGILGAILGRAVSRADGPRPAPLMPLLVVLPLVAGAEQLAATATTELCVVTTVEVDAPPDAVWSHVVAFPDLAAPTEWFFRCGIACPLRARIEGSGVGAIRHCEFTTGDFVEPVTVWDEPRHLAFDVVSKPDPMTELSFWRHVHPPHLADQSLSSHRGEFRLVPLGDSRTRLEGRTWYTFDMHPQAYWTLWSDLAIKKIHRRVLELVKRLAEADGR